MLVELEEKGEGGSTHGLKTPPEKCWKQDFQKGI